MNGILLRNHNDLDAALNPDCPLEIYSLVGASLMELLANRLSPQAGKSLVMLAVMPVKIASKLAPTVSSRPNGLFWLNTNGPASLVTKRLSNSRGEQGGKAVKLRADKFII